MIVTTLGAFPGANDKDKSARIPAAISALNKALAGDMAALDYMRAQSIGSATAVGKDAFRRALAIYDANKPDAARASTATAPVGLTPVPKPLPTPVLQPIGDVDPLHDPHGPPDRSVGWRWDPTLTGDGQWRGTWVRTAPVFVPGIAVPTQPKPIGFDTGQILVNPIPIHGGSVNMTTLDPRRGAQVSVGSSNGGVVTGPPAPEYSGPMSSSAPAPADFGYVAPTTTVTKADGTSSSVAAADAPKVSDNKILLVLAAGVALWLFVGSRRK